MHQKRQLQTIITALLLAAACTGFAQKGFLYQDGAPFLGEYQSASAVLPDGRVVTVGQQSSPQKKSDLWAVLYQTTGDTAWTWTAGGASIEYLQSVAASAEGIYAVGSADRSGAPKWDAVLVKLSLQGKEVWRRYLGGTGHDFGSHVAVDKDGNIWASTQYDTGDKVNGSDMKIYQYSLAGQLLGEKTLGGPGSDYSINLVPNPTGGVAGSFGRASGLTLGTFAADMTYKQLEDDLYYDQQIRILTPFSSQQWLIADKKGQLILFGEVYFPNYERAVVLLGADGKPVDRIVLSGIVPFDQGMLSGVYLPATDELVTLNNDGSFYRINLTDKSVKAIAPVAGTAFAPALLVLRKDGKEAVLSGVTASGDARTDILDISGTGAQLVRSTITGRKSGIGDEYVQLATQTTNGEYLLACTVRDTNSGSDTELRLIRLNADGKATWTYNKAQKGFTHQAKGVAPAPGGGFYVLYHKFLSAYSPEPASDTFVVQRWTAAGTLQWTRSEAGVDQYGYSELLNNHANRMAALPDGGVAILVRQGPVSKLFKWSDAGVKTFQYDIQIKDYQTIPTAITALKDGRLLCGGSHRSNETTVWIQPFNKDNTPGTLTQYSDPSWRLDFTIRSLDLAESNPDVFLVEGTAYNPAGDNEFVFLLTDAKAEDVLTAFHADSLSLSILAGATLTDSADLTQILALQYFPRYSNIPRPFNYFQRSVVTKASLFGDTPLWKVELGADITLYDGLGTSDGGYLAVGARFDGSSNQLYAIKIGPGGESVPVQHLGRTAERLRVYPNPVSDGRAQVSLDGTHRGAVQYELFDLSGRLVWQGNAQKTADQWTETLQWPQLEAGAYTLLATAGGMRYATVVIVR